MIKKLLSFSFCIFTFANVYIYSCANVRENTVASLKTAAYHGADMVEFDVQLSKDLIPVIYHDFYVSISLKRKKQIEAMDMLEIPVKDLTLQQLHLLKVSFLLVYNYTTYFYIERIVIKPVSF
jgi:glycerophosphoryl diester phosphodiesterase